MKPRDCPIPPRGKRVIRAWVSGTPCPKGSFLIARGRRGRPFLRSERTVREWERTLAFAASRKKPLLVEHGPVAAALDFVLPRPSSAPRRHPFRWALAARRPDLDKLARAALDALTGIVWRDDAQVVSLTVQKRRAWDGEPAGVTIEVYLVKDPDCG